MKKYLVCLLLFVCMGNGYAQSENLNKEITVSAGFANWDGWIAGAGFSYFMKPYLGISVGIDFMSAFNSLSVSGRVPGRNLRWITDGSTYDQDSKSSTHKRIQLNPSLIFRTPKWLILKNQDLYLSLSAEPGLILTLPNASVDVDYIPDVKSGVLAPVDRKSFHNSGGQWLFAKMGLGLNLHLDELSFGLKYGFSNLDYWSDYRKISIEGEKLDKLLPEKKYAHVITAFIGFSF